ncbi:hypothetical protein [Thioclava sp. IC9]|uniref:hypothetical protein n=1 Tax=Thioclava sp. IC9 TaxID=1973007 RepID=UPI000B547FFD|nr:hypothetical protein [Thioclava sp. IC9]OWY02302.1 hypothetical protein B6V76_12835 [Thioclava sp. IC9]
MSLKNRIERLERHAGRTSEEGPEIIFVIANRKEGEKQEAYPAFATFTGFPKHDLAALPEETTPDFEARAEKRLAELKAAGSAEQKGQ